MKKAYSVFILIFIGLTACNSSPQGSLLTEEPSSQTEEIVSTPIVPMPTAITIPTPFESYPIIVWKIKSLRDSIIQELSLALNYFSEANGIQSIQIDSDSFPSELNEGTRLLIVGENNNQIQNSLENYPNLSVLYLNQLGNYGERSVTIGVADNEEVSTAFISGYIAALASTEWRIAGIAVASEETQLHGFVNGTVYFCGLCNPIYPPFADYPLSTIFNDDVGAEAVRQIMQDYRSQGIEVLYLSPTLANNLDTVVFARKIGLKLVLNSQEFEGNLEFVIANVRTNWNQPLELVLTSSFSNQAVDNFYSPILISIAQNSILSEGQLNHLDEIIYSLSVGEVDPLQ